MTKKDYTRVSGPKCIVVTIEAVLKNPIEKIHFPGDVLHHCLKAEIVGFESVTESPLEALEILNGRKVLL